METETKKETIEEIVEDILTKTKQLEKECKELTEDIFSLKNFL